MAKYRLVTTLSNGNVIDSDTFEIDDATIEVGTTETLAAGEKAYVKNGGNSHNAVLNFGIPAGAAGADGKDGSGPQYYQHHVTMIINASSGGGCICFSFINTSSTYLSTWNEVWSLMNSAKGSGSKYLSVSGYYGAAGSTATRTPIFCVFAGTSSSIEHIYIVNYFDDANRYSNYISESDIYTIYDAVLTIN